MKDRLRKSSKVARSAYTPRSFEITAKTQAELLDCLIEIDGEEGVIQSVKFSNSVPPNDYWVIVFQCASLPHPADDPNWGRELF